MTQESPPTPDTSSSRRSVRLRLVVGVPVALALVALAAGVGAIEVIHLMEPGLEGDSAARLWAVVIVVVFSLVIGGLGLLFVRMLQAPLEEVIRELEKRLEPADRSPTTAAVPGPARPGPPAGGRAAADEVSLARRTIGEYLRRLDEYRIDAALLEEIEEALVVLDGNGEVVHANDRARELFAPEDPGLRGRPFGELIGEPSVNLGLRSLARRCVAELGEAEDRERRTTVTEELVVTLPSGETAAMRVRGHVSTGGFELGGGASGKGDGARPGVLLALQPVDEHEEATLRMERRDRLAALGTLVSEVAHEVRNPLGSLEGLTQLVSDRLPDDDPAREHLAEISDRIRGVTRYLDEILDYSQPRSLDPEEVDLGDLLEEARRSVSAESREAGVQVALEVDPDAPSVVRADPDRLLQVLVNLLRNALEAVEEGGDVSVEATSSPADADLGEEAGVELRVHNTGSHVPPERREEIFRPFVSTRERGTGLGLAISRYLVRLHDGTITVESDPDEGTTFVVRLPDAGDAAAGSPARVTREEGRGDGSGEEAL